MSQRVCLSTYILYISLHAAYCYRFNILLQLATKDACAQNILAHEALYKVSQLLDQFKQGLKKVDMLRLVQAFPDLYIALLTFSGDISAEDVLGALYVDETETELELGDQLILQFLHRYVQECSDTGMCDSM